MKIEEIRADLALRLTPLPGVAGWINDVEGETLVAVFPDPRC